MLNAPLGNICKGFRYALECGCMLVTFFIVIVHARGGDSTEAKPFYPMSLRAIFDSEPAHFSCADESPCVKYMDYICKQNSSRQIGHLSVWKSSFFELETCLEANDREQAPVLFSSVVRRPIKDRILPLSSRCSCYKRQLAQVGVHCL